MCRQARILKKGLKYSSFLAERRQLKDLRRALGEQRLDAAAVKRELAARVAALPEDLQENWNNEIRDRRRAEEQQRIRLENAAHYGRIANMRPVIDDDTEDDATGEARARLRAEAAARRRAEEAALAQDNASFFGRVFNTESRLSHLRGSWW